MNRQCIRCKRIITIPDIPLPEGYTQKCSACGFDNPVNETAAAQAQNTPKPKQAKAPAQDPRNAGNWQPRFDEAAAPPAGYAAQAPRAESPDFKAELEKAKQELRKEFEGKMRLLEERLASQHQSYPNPLMNPVGPDNKVKAFQAQIHERVLENKVLVATQTANVIRSCEATLQRQGYDLQPITTLNSALEIITKKYFQMVIIDQKIMKYSSDSQALLTAIKRIPLATRRCQTFVMITPTINTGESQVFYQWGIDLNVNPKDLDRLDQILEDIHLLKEQLLEEYLADLFAYH